MGTRMKSPPKTFHVKSFGCQMNVYDGERMAELMAADGLVATDDANVADLVVLNTCHIREKATEKVYSDIGRIRKHAGKDGRAPMIAVAGCVAQAEGAEIVRRAKVDVVVGPQAYHNLPRLVADAASGNAALDTHMPLASKFGALPARRKVGPSAFLTVQEGCNKFCTYCVVPYTRGAEVSRPYAAIMDEARALIESAIVRTLCGLVNDRDLALRRAVEVAVKGDQVLAPERAQAGQRGADKSVTLRGLEHHRRGSEVVRGANDPLQYRRAS